MKQKVRLQTWIKTKPERPAQLAGADHWRWLHLGVGGQKEKTTPSPMSGIPFDPVFTKELK